MFIEIATLSFIHILSVSVLSKLHNATKSKIDLEICVKVNCVKHKSHLVGTEIKWLEKIFQNMAGELAMGPASLHRVGLENSGLSSKCVRQRSIKPTLTIIIVWGIR